MMQKFPIGFEPADPIASTGDPITFLINGSGFGVVAVVAVIVLTLHMIFRADARK